MFLIKSGGGTGPMKPGNQHVSLACMVPIPAGVFLGDEKWKFFGHCRPLLFEVVFFWPLRKKYEFWEELR